MLGAAAVNLTLPLDTDSQPFPPRRLRERALPLL